MPVHITHVRIEPEEATVAPAAMSSVLSMTTPTNAAARPAVALRNEIRTGMSAPPMRMANTTPSSIDAAMRPRSSNCCAAPPVTALPTVSATPTAMMSRRIRLCCLKTVGCCLILLASLAAAIMLPANVAEPTMSPM